MQNQSQHQNIYLDTCCLGRPFDEQTQERIRQETQALREIGDCFITSQLRWISSTVLEIEVGNNPRVKQRNEVMAKLSLAHQTVQVGASETACAAHLQQLGFPSFDALHIACAESGGADVLLTTDDVFINRAKRLRQHLHVDVENPRAWLQVVRGART